MCTLFLTLRAPYSTSTLTGYMDNFVLNFEHFGLDSLGDHKTSRLAGYMLRQNFHVTEYSRPRQKPRMRLVLVPMYYVYIRVSTFATRAP